MINLFVCWSPADDNGCHFGHHCHRQAGDVIIKIEVARNELMNTLIYHLLL